jgi:purine-binding chemotaxis protein CheW
MVMEKIPLSAPPPGKVVNVAYRGYKDGYSDFFGDQVQVLTGYPREEFNSRNLKWTDLILEADREGARNAFVAALKGDKTYMREYRIRHKDQRILWMQEWGQIVCSESGAIEYVIGIVVDINEARKLDEARLEANRLTGKYLTFRLGREEFGIHILKVREIVAILPVTPVPSAPPFVKGVVNLRGKVIPVVDLRLKLAMDSLEATDRTCIIMLEVRRQNKTMVFGLIVDSVSEVIQIRGEDIEKPPQVLVHPDRQYLLGLAKVNGRVKILLDVDGLDPEEDLASVSDQHQSPAK